MNLNSCQIVNAFSVDFEDWFQGLEIIHLQEWHRYESRIEKSAEKILSLLDEGNVKATFFILGYLVEKCPALITEIKACGHEIATHGYSHELIYKQSLADFASEFRKAVEITEDLAGVKVIGHRAPFFSITKDSLWAFNVLVQNGIKYDSSIFPVFNYRYGIPESLRDVYTIKAENGGELKEIPMSSVRILNVNVPIAGGAYLRIFPYWFLKWSIKKLNKIGQPAVIYIHPWELDAKHPRLKLPFRIKATHYHNLESTESKLRALFRDFRFSTMKDVFKIR